MSAPTIRKLTCRGCGTQARADQTSGWLIETWLTVGGGKVRVVTCRRLTVPFEGSERCDGRCGGHHNGYAAWRGDCLTCQEAPEDFDGEVFEPCDDAQWRCVELGCVQAWAEQHRNCEITITRPWEVA